MSNYSNSHHTSQSEKKTNPLKQKQLTRLTKSRDTFWIDPNSPNWHRWVAKGKRKREKIFTGFSFFCKRELCWFTLELTITLYRDTRGKLRPWVSKVELRNAIPFGSYAHELLTSCNYDIYDDNCTWTLPYYRVKQIFDLGIKGVLTPIDETPANQLDCDHINGNTLDHRKCNLQLLTVSEHAKKEGKVLVSVNADADNVLPFTTGRCTKRAKGVAITKEEILKKHGNSAAVINTNNETAKEEKIKKAEWFEDYWNKVDSGNIKRPEQAVDNIWHNMREDGVPEKPK